MRILISGASGFIGKPLTFFLTSQGHTIVRLVRDVESRASDTVQWNPEEEKARREDFEGFDVVIHLAGEPLTLSRWNHTQKERILHSRTVGTMFLSHLLSTTHQPPKLFLSASATGYYGDRGEEILTEESLFGETFLSKVCAAWEIESSAMANRGARTVQTRFGMVLGPHGGALAKMLLPYRLGLGGRLGSGKQWMPWIALEDLIRAIDHIINNESLEGPVNLVAPNAVRQEEFSQTLAEILHRPRLFPMSSWLLHMLYGETADEMVLASAHVEPQKLLVSKFAFRYPDLRSAICKALQTI